MKVRSSKGTSMLLGEKTNLTAQAKYFSGGSLKDSPITWSVSASPRNYAPPGWQEFRFGHDFPYWDLTSIHHSFKNKLRTVQVNANVNGEGTAQLRLDQLPEPRPVSCNCEATIQDVNRQSWSDQITVLVHPSDTYVGVKQDRSFYSVKDPIELDLIAVDLDGIVREGRSIKVELQKVEQTRDNKGKLVLVETTEVTSGKLPVKCSFKVEEGGQYQTAVTVIDAEGRKNETHVSTWVNDEKMTSTKDLRSDKLLVIADKEEYKAGDTAEVMVSSPFYPAHGIITIRRVNVIETIPIDLESSSATFKIPIKQDYYPNFALEVYLAGMNYRFGSELLRLKVPPEARRLKLSAKARDPVIQPGSDTTIDIELKDASGKPVKNGQVALAVADESVLALSGYK
ncbi:MAG: hypothetical protein K8F91_08390, partial [Candidatus Obscuribacterales bacterium]|nr:hypothetical protein [Candidatus Obscuribacterales bacterium]